MPRMRHRLRSDLSNLVETKAILKKIRLLVALSAHHLVIEKGTYRANASLLDRLALDETASHNNIKFSRKTLASGEEQETIACIADLGAFEISDVTAVADVAGSLNNKYFTFEDPSAAHKFYVWFNINSAGVDPALAGRTGVQVAGATGATAATLGGAMRAALGGSTAATYFTISGATTHAILTSKKVGNAVNTADGAAPTGFTFTLTQGVASNLNSKWFKLWSANDATKYYVWFNVNSEGVDPAPAGFTSIAVAIAAGATASSIGGTMATAIAAANTSADFTAVNGSGTVTVTNKTAGPSTNATDGTAATGFSFTSIGDLEAYDTADIQIIRRLRTKKWMIKIKGDASGNPA